jgi:hypothetical protein
MAIGFFAFCISAVRGSRNTAAVCEARHALGLNTPRIGLLGAVVSAFDYTRLRSRYQNTE